MCCLSAEKLRRHGSPGRRDKLKRPHNLGRAIDFPVRLYTDAVTVLLLRPPVPAGTTTRLESFPFSASSLSSSSSDSPSSSCSSSDCNSIAWMGGGDGWGVGGVGLGGVRGKGQSRGRQREKNTRQRATTALPILPTHKRRRRGRRSKKGTPTTRGEAALRAQGTGTKTRDQPGNHEIRTIDYQTINSRA